MAHFRMRQGCALLVVAVSLWGQASRAQDGVLTGADWEAHALGITTPERLAAVRAAAVRRPVTLAIVGQGGVSKALLEPVLVDGTTLGYRQWPEGQTPDPGTNTHDTQAARVILDLTHKLGIQVRLLVYHVGETTDSVAEGFSRAGAEADIVALYQSFWGNVQAMADSIGTASGALFISPYVEVGPRDTATCLQAHAAKPWAEGFPHFITTIPLARQSPGVLLTPQSRPGQDTEAINFVAPSYYASSAGGTCPSAEVAAAVAAYIVAATSDKPAPEEIVALMRQTSTDDRASLGSLPEFDEASLDAFGEQIAALATATDTRPRKLDATGVLNLWAIHEHIATGGAEQGHDD
jgi:hypothetical protein